VFDRFSAHATRFESWRESRKAWVAEREALFRQHKAAKFAAYREAFLAGDAGKPGLLQRGAGFLRSLAGALASAPPAAPPPGPQELAARADRHALGRLWAEVDAACGPEPEMPEPPKGAYLHGPVGSGKTMLLDLFFERLSDSRPGDTSTFRRVHFNRAMLEANRLINRADVEAREAREARAGAGGGRGGPGRAAVMAARRRSRQSARGTLRDAGWGASNAECMRRAAHMLLYGRGGLGGTPEREDGPPPVLCFDEVQCTDPFSALVLKGLMEAVIGEGGVVLCTSNRRLGDLPRQGLHEHLFGHFVSHVRANVDEVRLDVGKDYRRVLSAEAAAGAAGGGGGGGGGTYFHPLGEEAEGRLERAWEREVAAAGGAAPAGESVPVLFGRRLDVRRSAGGAAWFDFAELCDRPVGPADYVALADRFHTVLISGVPGFSAQSRDRARRFITLVDELYNARCRLIVSAGAAPDELFGKDCGAWDEALVDLEQLQFEAAVEGAGLRRDVAGDGGVAVVGAGGAAGGAGLVARLGGREEEFAFARAASRLMEMQSGSYLRAWERSLAHRAGAAA